jgi:hypothetical protein
MPGDREIGALTELFEQWSDGALIKLNHSATVRADQVMSVLTVSFGADIGVATIRAVKAVEDTTVNQHIERAEDGCSPDRFATPRQEAQ